MKASPLSLPAALHRRAGPEARRQWSGVGNAALLDEPLLGLIASRGCPGSVLLETLDRVPRWVKEGQVILSGFHAPLEIHRTTRAIALARNRLVLALATEIVIPYLAASSPSAALIAEQDVEKKAEVTTLTDRNP